MPLQPPSTLHLRVCHCQQTLQSAPMLSLAAGHPVAAFRAGMSNSWAIAPLATYPSSGASPASWCLPASASPPKPPVTAQARSRPLAYGYLSWCVDNVVIAKPSRAQPLAKAWERRCRGLPAAFSTPDQWGRRIARSQSGSATRRGAGLHPTTNTALDARTRPLTPAEPAAPTAPPLLRQPLRAQPSTLLTSGPRPAPSSCQRRYDPVTPWSVQPASGRPTHATSSEAPGGQPPDSASTGQQAESLATPRERAMVGPMRTSGHHSTIPERPSSNRPDFPPASPCGNREFLDDVPHRNRDHQTYGAVRRVHSFFPYNVTDARRWVLCAARYVFLQRTLKTKGGQGGGPRRAVRPPFDT